MASIWEFLLGAAQAAPPQQARPAAIPQQLASDAEKALMIKQSLSGAFGGQQSPEYKYWQEQLRKKQQAAQGEEY